MSLHSRSPQSTQCQRPQLQRSSAVHDLNLQARRQALEETNIKKLLIPSQKPKQEPKPDSTPVSPSSRLHRSSAVKYNTNPLTRRNTPPQLSPQHVHGCEYSSSPTDSSDIWLAQSKLTRACTSTRTSTNTSTLPPLASANQSQRHTHLSERTLRDMELPQTVHSMVDSGASCAEIGRYLVQKLHGSDSFYSELVDLLVA
ncbi:hypothetical protein BDW74DRAFT_142132 [Aspergillus multicolor]|uniref:uncharacterized protein n=1 Tax=Aspergillus multicolor TaxID=41759 RepID=UPI003CCDB90C